MDRGGPAADHLAPFDDGDLDIELRQQHRGGAPVGTGADHDDMASHRYTMWPRRAAAMPWRFGKRCRRSNTRTCPSRHTGASGGRGLTRDREPRGVNAVIARLLFARQPPA
jgi:hypothetical protein